MTTNWQEIKGDHDTTQYLRRYRRILRITRWMNHIPFVGKVMFVFWSNLLDQGIKDTVVPRWGAMTFSFLNDGMKPTLWHTWYEMTHDMGSFWPGGAPRNAADAERISALYAKEEVK